MGSVVIDAGVVIAILDGRDAHHAAARAAIAALSTSNELVLPASAYSELMGHPYEDGPDEVALADGFVDALPARVEPASRQIARAAAELRARHGRSLRLPDALVVGTALVIGADRIVTTDGRWPEVGIAVHVVGGS
jgi:predicted nucleic acid-binding protein